MKRIVRWNDEADGVDQELGSDIEEDEEKVQGAKPENNVDLGNTRVLFKLIEIVIFSELLIELRNVILGAILDSGL